MTLHIKIKYFFLLLICLFNFLVVSFAPSNIAVWKFMDARNSVFTSKDTQHIDEDEEEETKKMTRKKIIFIVRDCFVGWMCCSLWVTKRNLNRLLIKRFLYKWWSTFLRPYAVVTRSFFLLFIPRSGLHMSGYFLSFHTHNLFFVCIKNLQLFEKYKNPFHLIIISQQSRR